MASREKFRLKDLRHLLIIHAVFSSRERDKQAINFYRTVSEMIAFQKMLIPAEFQVAIYNYSSFISEQK
jgi:hypothetical protein